MMAKGTCTWVDGDVRYTWTAGRDYSVEIGESLARIECDDGTLELPAEVMMASPLPESLFGLSAQQIAAGETQAPARRRRRYFKDWRNLP